MKQEHRLKCRKIFEHYTFESQARQLAEEASELSVAALKTIRTDDKSILVKRADLLSEIADVLIMIEQISPEMNISDVDIENMIEYKLNRQLKRIKEQGY